MGAKKTAANRKTRDGCIIFIIFCTMYVINIVSLFGSNSNIDFKIG